MVKRPEMASRHLAASGLAMVRTDTAVGAVAALLKASADDGDAHGHPDQLGVAIFGGGARVAIDPGTPGYGIALNDTWYRQSISHSTVIIDGRSQPPGEAKIIRFETADGRTDVEAEITWPEESAWHRVVERARSIAWPDQDPYVGYAGVMVRRRLELQANQLVDTVVVVAHDARVIDLVLQLPRTTEPLGEGWAPTDAETLGAGSGYEHLIDLRMEAGTSAALEATLPNGTLRVETWFDDQSEEVRFLGSAPGNPAADRHAVLIRRQLSVLASFATTLTWD
jgi:hypothetical protein